mgnify:CR=1 FL=1
MESIGGRGALKDLYALLKEHPKAKKNPHYQERIRATLYEHPDEYIPVSKGYFSFELLGYMKKRAMKNRFFYDATKGV